ncbi:hypothetical protein OLK001_01800 [Synechocystis sp. LKSZ1]
MQEEEQKREAIDTFERIFEIVDQRWGTGDTFSAIETFLVGRKIILRSDNKQYKIEKYFGFGKFNICKDHRLPRYCVSKEFLINEVKIFFPPIPINIVENYNKIPGEEIQCKQEREKGISTINYFLRNKYILSFDLYLQSLRKVIDYNEFLNARIKFVEEWFIESQGVSPDQLQLHAISEVNHHIQVISRAGSGKTSTIVNRALFLQKHCGIEPQEMLLLAFNRKAANEIQSRLSDKLGKQQTPHVMTFHALAYALVHPEEELLIDQSDGLQNKSQVLHSIINNYLEDPIFYDKIKWLMLDRYRQDWEKIEAIGFNKTPEERLNLKRSLPREGLDGNRYKSYGEKIIANFLFERDIPYRYERNYDWNGINYRPDFTIFTNKNSGIIIEYFGLEGDPDYDKMSDKKREFWRNKSGWNFLEFSPQDILNDNLLTELQYCLEDLGVSCQKLSEEEIWKKVKDRAIDNFTKAMVQFIQRCRKLSLTTDELSRKIHNHQYDNEIEKRFHDLGQTFYNSYLKRLVETGEDDFDGLMQRAADSIRAGNTIFRRKSGAGDLKELKYIFIDEYQDFSQLFYNLIDAIRQFNSNALFFCVGDDWQAINSFAGSDLVFFEKFTDYFPDAKKLYLSNNYRSKQSIVKISNSLMQGRGVEGKPNTSEQGNVHLIDLNDFHPDVLENHDYPGDKITPALIRIINTKLQAGKEVVILSRKSSIPWYVNGNRELDDFVRVVHQHFKLDNKQKGKITISTTHQYKGLEKAVVIIIDAIQGCYPLIHPDWIFMKIFGDTQSKLIDDERRLFYVALSRAVDELFIVTDTLNGRSEFLENLDKNHFSTLDFSKYPYISHKSTIIVKIKNRQISGSSDNAGTFAIRDQLRADGYRWNSQTYLWSKSIEPHKFRLYDHFSNSPWKSSASGIEIIVCDSQCQKPLAIFHVDNGKITRLNFQEYQNQTDHEIQRLGWSPDQCRAYLKNKYGQNKPSRSLLSDEELQDFLNYLKLQ